MANPLGKGWNYLKSSMDKKIDENADPKIQIEQAIAAEKERHQQITDSAASIIGTKSQLEMKMNRLVESQAQYQKQARDAVLAADKASSPEEQQRLTETAEVLASQLVAVETELENTKVQYEQATQAAEQAKQQQKESEVRLQEAMSQVQGLKQQADQARMQEMNSEMMQAEDPLAPSDSTPTLDDVRAKIEQRYSKALGAQELYQNSVGEHIEEISASGNDMRATARLDQIRAEFSGGGATGADKQIEAPEQDTAQDTVQGAAQDQAKPES